MSSTDIVGYSEQHARPSWLTLQAAFADGWQTDQSLMLGLSRAHYASSEATDASANVGSAQMCTREAGLLHDLDCTAKAGDDACDVAELYCRK